MSRIFFFILVICSCIWQISSKNIQCKPTKHSILQNNGVLGKLYIDSMVIHIEKNKEDLISTIDTDSNPTFIVLDAIEFSGHYKTLQFKIEEINKNVTALKYFRVTKIMKEGKLGNKIQCNIGFIEEQSTSDLEPAVESAIIKSAKTCIQSEVCGASFGTRTDGFNQIEKLPNHLASQGTINSMMDFTLNIAVKHFLKKGTVFEINHSKYGFGVSNISIIESPSLYRVSDILFENSVGSAFKIGLNYALNTKISLNDVKVPVLDPRSMPIHINGIKLKIEVVIDYNRKPCTTKLADFNVKGLQNALNIDYSNFPAPLRVLVWKNTVKFFIDVILPMVLKPKLEELVNNFECEKYLMV